jgi:hypothetical protein
MVENSSTTGTRPIDGAWVIERRRDARLRVSWDIWWIIGERAVVLKAKTLDASRHGVRIEISMKDLEDLGHLDALLVPGQRHQLEILVSGGPRLTRLAEIRHVGAGSIGFEVEEELPVERLMRIHLPDPPSLGSRPHTLER